jgi:hypothetical protein
VPKFPSNRFPPGFFDLPRDAGETLPLEIIAEWTRSTQTREVARAILGPRTLKGIVVSSDAAGLTRLGRERSLIEILALINRPKELVHAFGSAIGGRSIGVWAADNTEMFYGDWIDPARVVSLLLTVQARVGYENGVGIGLAAHAGEFYELAGGLYGPDADRVELLAEEHTEGGELIVTSSLADRLPGGHGFTLVPRGDLTPGYGVVYRVAAGATLDDIEPTDFRYPLPFSDDFYTGLGAYQRTRRESVVPRPAYQDRTIVLIEREQEDRDIPEVAALNDLALAAGTKRLGAALLQDSDGEEIKTSGLIGIYGFRSSIGAVAFARNLRSALADQGISSRIGLDKGRVLLFELGPGARDVAGSPVNIASKLAQDCGEFGGIYLSEAVAREAGLAGLDQPIAFQVSAVTLTCYRI